MAGCTSVLHPEVLSFDEYSGIKEEVRVKIEKHVRNLIDESTVSKALLATHKSNSDQLIGTLQTELSMKNNEIESLTNQVSVLNLKLDEYEKNIKKLTEENQTLEDSVQRLKSEVVSLRGERNLTIDERDSLLKQLEHHQADKERWEIEVTSLETQLRNALHEKTRVQLEAQDIVLLKDNLEFREKQLTKEKTGLENEVKALTGHLVNLEEELKDTRRRNTLQRAAVENELCQLNDALTSANNTIANLERVNKTLEGRLQEAVEQSAVREKRIIELETIFNDELRQNKSLVEFHEANEKNAEEKCIALQRGLSELRGLLDDAVKQMEKCESEKASLKKDYEEKLQDKMSIIEGLEHELETTNCLIKGFQEANNESCVEELSPTAASLARAVGSGMTLSQVYTQLSNAAKELMMERAENKRLKLQVKMIIQDVESKAPEVAALKSSHKAAVDKINQLNDLINLSTEEKSSLLDEICEMKKQRDFYEREYRRRESTVKDLSRQVCHLLEEKEKLNSKKAAKEDGTHLATCSSVINEHLVTFDDIRELQEMNKKLLGVVRELSERAEKEDEKKDQEDDLLELKALLETRQRQVAEIQEQLFRYKSMMNKAMVQLEQYKQQYGSIDAEQNASAALDPSSGGGIASIPSAGSASDSAALTPDIDHNEVKELREKLQKAEKALKESEEAYERYSEDRRANDKYLQDQLETTKNQLTEMRINANKMLTQLEYNQHKCDILQANCSTFKNQITSLESRNKAFSKTIATHEATIQHLRDELTNYSKQVARGEITIDSLHRECTSLKEAVARLAQERDSLKEHSRSQSVLLANLEMLRCQVTRTEDGNRLKFENRFDEILKENSAFRIRLKEEEEKFQRVTVDMQHEVEKHKKRYEEEKELVKRTKEELDAVKKELTNAKTEIGNLNIQIQESRNQLPLLQKTSELADAKNKVKELDKQLKHLNEELKIAQELLELEKNHNKEFCSVSEVLESKLNETQANFESYRESSEKRAARALEKEEELTKQISDLESKLSALQSGSDLSSAQLSIQLLNTQKELQSVQEECDKAKQELASSRLELLKLASSAQLTEEKYANEISAHSADARALLEVKAQLNSLNAQINDLKTAKELAEEGLKTGKENWEERETLLQHELHETQQRLSDLDEQNTLLLEQIESLGSKIAFLEGQGYLPCSESAPESSVEVTDGSLNKSLDLSFTEDGAKTSEQLLRIIKFVRQEKLMALNKYEIIRCENSRLKSQVEHLQKLLDETRTSLSAEREAKEVDVLASVKQSEVLRKVETLNALTDSNRVLRSDRDSLAAEKKELEARIESLAQELGPSREKIRDYTARINSMEAENSALRGEATRLRQRVNFLIERSSKTSPEDWRRLQQEREALARQISIDREALQRKDDEIRTLRQEKARLEEQVSNLSRQVQQQGDEIKRQADELHAVQQRLAKVTQDLSDTRNAANKKNEELAKITEDLGAKEALLTEVKNKEMQIRKIAKKYKTQWEELNKTSEEDKKKIEEMEKALAATQTASSMPAASADISSEAQEALREECRRQVEMRIAEAETRHSDRVKELVDQVTSSHEEAESLRKENDSLKSSAADKEERAKGLLKQARGKINQLQEINTSNTEKIKTLEARLKSLEQGTEEETVRMSALKSQYENRIARLEKECTDLKVEKQQKLDACHQRVTQLEKQLEKYQGIQLQSASVQPWSSRGDPPFASIRPMAQSRTAAVYPVSSQIPSTTISPITPVTTVLVPPQQLQAHTAASASTGPAVTVTVHPWEEPPLSVQPAAESAQTMEAEIAIIDNLPQNGSAQPQWQMQQHQQEYNSSVDQSASQGVEQQSHTQPAQQQPPQQQPQQDLHQSQTPEQEPQQLQQQQQELQQLEQQQQQLQELEPQQEQEQQQSQAQQAPLSQLQPPVQPAGGSPTTPQAQQAVAKVLPRVEQLVAAAAVSPAQPQLVGQSAAAPSSHASTNSSNVRNSEAGGTAKRSRELDDSAEETNQGKRSRLAGKTKGAFRASSAAVFDSVLEVEYQVATSSQCDEEEVTVESEEEGVADEVIEIPGAGPEFEDDGGNPDGYAIGPYSDEMDTSFEEAEGPDIDDENPQDPDNNEAEIMDDSSEVPNQSETCSSVRKVSVPPRPPASQQHGQASSSGPTEVGSMSTEGVSASRVSRGPARSVSLLSRQQQQQSQLLLGYEEAGDDSIVPSTPTLFVPRRSDGFGEAVSSPQVPQTRFTFSDTNTSATRGVVSQVPPETIELSQLEEAGTGRSVPTTPPQVSPQECVETGQSEGGGEGAMPPNEVQPKASGSQTTVPSITVTVAPGDETSETTEEKPPLENAGNAESEEAPEQRDSGEQSSEQEEGLELADESGDGVSSEGEKSLPVEDVEEGREAEATGTGEPFETVELQDSPRRVTRAANTARRSVRPYRGPRGRPQVRPTPIVWNEPQSSMGSQSSRGFQRRFYEDYSGFQRRFYEDYSGRGAMMGPMRGGPNEPLRGYSRGGPRNRRPRGKPKGNFGGGPYQMRF